MKTFFAASCLVALALFAGCTPYQHERYHYGAGGSFPGSGCSSCIR